MTTRITTPGIYKMRAAEYHADPCLEPSLSSTIARVLCDSAPAHAQHAHPRLNLQNVEEEAEHFDIGTAAHAILLEGEAAVTVIDAKDWRTNAAKDARDAARAAGKLPLLAKIWADVQAMVAAARVQLAAHHDGRAMFLNGEPEQTLIWREEDLWCRARLDWLRDGAIDDYKTTSASANPEVLSRTLFGNGWDIQAAFYLRGLKAITGIDAAFRFACQETYAPYALSVVALGPDAMMLAEKKILWALDLWRECLQSNRWPAYPTQTAYASLPPWVESAWLEKELR
jgi:hypothetical protein